MATDKKLLNFRCPVDLIAAIDQLGQQRYPAINENGCDRSKTLLDIITAGIQSLTDGSIVIPITSDVKQKSVLQSDIDIDAIKAELRDQLMLEIDQRINASIQPIRGELLEKLTIINADNEALRQQVSVLQSDNEVLHSQIEALSNTPDSTLGNLLNQEVVEPETILSNIPGIAPDEIEAVSVEATEASRQQGEVQSEVDNLYIDIDGVHHSYPVEYEVFAAEGEAIERAIAPILQTSETEAVQPAPTDDAAPIPDDAEKVDAAENITATGDNVATVEPEAVGAIADDPMPEADELLTTGEMAKLFPDVAKNPAQKFRDLAKSTTERSKTELLNLGYESVPLKEGDKINYFFRKLP